MVGDLKEAAEVYEHGERRRLFIWAVDAILTYYAVIQADPANNDARMKLAEILEILNEPRKALELVLQGKQSL